MSFNEGQTVVHPFHGPLRVTCVSERVVKGASRSYFDLTALRHPLRISIPVDNVDDVGLRPLATKQRVADLLSILRAPADPQPQGWARRLKDYQMRLSSGDVEQLCYVVREITRRNPKSPASAESQLLRSASATLAIEISLSLDVHLEVAHELIAEAAAAASQ